MGKTLWLRASQLRLAWECAASIDPDATDPAIDPGDNVPADMGTALHDWMWPKRVAIRWRASPQVLPFW